MMQASAAGIAAVQQGMAARPDSTATLATITVPTLVICGEEDTFYLEGATVLLQKSLKKLGSDALVEIFPGKDHGTLMDRKMRLRISREMANRFRASKLES